MRILLILYLALFYLCTYLSLLLPVKYRQRHMTRSGERTSPTMQNVMLSALASVILRINPARLAT